MSIVNSQRLTEQAEGNEMTKPIVSTETHNACCLPRTLEVSSDLRKKHQHILFREESSQSKIATHDRDLDQDILLENRDLREEEADGGTGSDTPDGGGGTPVSQSPVLFIKCAYVE